MWFLAQEIRDSTLRGRQLLVVDAQASHRGLDHALLVRLVIDHEILAVSLAADLQRLDIAAQQAHAERVEGRDQRLGQRARPHQRLDAAGHLARGLIGEGNRENGVGRDADMVDQVRDAISDDARLAAAGAGQDQYRPADRFHGFTLLGI